MSKIIPDDTQEKVKGESVKENNLFAKHINTILD